MKRKQADWKIDPHAYEELATNRMPKRIQNQMAYRSDLPSTSCEQRQPLHQHSEAKQKRPTNLHTEGSKFLPFAEVFQVDAKNKEENETRKQQEHFLSSFAAQIRF